MALFRYKIPKRKVQWQVWIGGQRLAPDEFTVGRNGDLILKRSPDKDDMVSVVTKGHAVPRRRVRSHHV